MKNDIINDMFWDQRWNKIKLPVEVNENITTPYIKEILNVFSLFLPKNMNCNILEIGGAPGGYLAYMAKKFGYSVNAIDYSVVGCQKIIENFKLLKIPVTVYNIDILKDDLSRIPQFDIVYSLGLIEHFADPIPIIEKHIYLVKPKGFLIIGLPIFLGINRLLLKMLNPDYLCWHNLKTMDIENWEMYEKRFNFDIIFKGYVGSWEPRIYINNRGLFLDRIAKIMIKIIASCLDRIQFMRKCNSKYWSCYAIAIYRKL